MKRRVTIIGDGKMGRGIAELAIGHGFEVAALLGSAAVKARGLSKDLLSGADVALEFTNADSAPGNIRECVAAGVPVVSGTTGWEAARPGVEDEVRRAGGALLWSANFSIGVHILLAVAAETARRLAAAGGFEAHLVETHHAAKKDAPSGTARRIQEAVEGAMPLPVTSVRVGHVPGRHELVFDAPFEQLRLVHDARDRRVFALGALKAASWIIGRRGVFGLEDMLR